MNKEIDNIKQLKKGRVTWRLLGENFVFQEGDHFYKMPTFLAKNLLYQENNSYEKVIDSMRLIQKYFGKIATIGETTVLKDADGHYIIKQKGIQGEKITKKHLRENPKLASKLKRIIMANEQMWEQEGVFLDLLGSDILVQPNTIHNLMTDGEEIYIFDFGLLEKNSHNIFFRMLSKFTRWFQPKFLEKNF